MPYDGRPWPIRFWEKVPAPLGDECMEWTGHRNQSGYGQHGRDGKRWMAHRISYEMHNGPIPQGMQVCHHCDNPPCVRPDHLFLGTARDNARDRQNKGRFTPPVFDRDSHPMSKISAGDAETIVRTASTGRGGNVAELAEQYGVTITTIHNILRANRQKAKEAA